VLRNTVFNEHGSTRGRSGRSKHCCLLRGNEASEGTRGVEEAGADLVQDAARQSVPGYAPVVGGEARRLDVVGTCVFAPGHVGSVAVASRVVLTSLDVDSVADVVAQQNLCQHVVGGVPGYSLAVILAAAPVLADLIAHKAAGEGQHGTAATMGVEGAEVGCRGIGWHGLFILFWGWIHLIIRGLLVLSPLPGRATFARGRAGCGTRGRSCRHFYRDVGSKNGGK
jgi:hypothetical protein